LIVGCLARPAGTDKDRDRLVAVVTAGLRR